MDDAVLLPRARPDEVGVDPAGVHALLDGWARRGIQPHTLVLVRHGRICAEGAWAPHRLSDAPLLYSLSKTFTSAAVGLAVADGAFGYDDRLVDLFSDVADAAGPVASRIRVRDCLAMTTGHTHDDTWSAGLARAQGRLPWRTALAVEPDGEPGVTFRYNQWATWTLAEIVRQRTGRSVLDVVRDRVFAPLGIAGATWDADPRGRLMGFTGLHLRPEAVAAFFQLLLAEGVWRGERVLPVEWVTRFRRRQAHIEGAENPDWGQGYGWQVWLDRHGGYRGDGAFGQFALVLPDQDAVLVTTGHTSRMQEVLDEVWDSLLPAFDRPAGADADGLASRLADLRLPTVGGERGAGVHLSFENRTNRWRLEDDHGGWTLRWVDAEGGDNTVGVGHRHWRTSMMRWGGRRLRVAASGAWVEWGHWVGHLVALDAPHALLVRLRDDGSGRTEWIGSPPLGRPAWPALAVDPPESTRT